jgi:hypothetical protein
MTATGAVAVAPQSGRGALTAAPEPSEEVAQTQPETDRRPHYARVPLPPRGRPASIDEKVTETAALETSAPELRPATDIPDNESSDAAGKHHFVKAPLPPHRPARLVAIADPEGNRAKGANAAHAPSSTDAQPGKDDPALAYAPAASEEAAPDSVESKPAQRAANRGYLVPARLDRSNFNALTAAAPTARASARPVMGAQITGVRSAARAGDPNALLPPARPAHLVGFSEPDTPPSNKFSQRDSRSRSPSQKSDTPEKK